MVPITQSDVGSTETCPLLMRPIEQRQDAPRDTPCTSVQYMNSWNLSLKTKWLSAISVGLLSALLWMRFASVLPQPSFNLPTQAQLMTMNYPRWNTLCNKTPCFQRAIIRVPEGKPGFPSFWNFAPFGPINVSYDERAILLNGTRALLLGGSMHPARATYETWVAALDEAVENGLNMITIYVFWSAHQTFSDSPYDWSLPGNACCNRLTRSCANSSPSQPDTRSCASTHWNLATAIREAANRGLFVHARIGPYTCAEYSYGGIPEWVPWNQPNMSMRRPNQAWMNVMEEFLKNTIQYLTEEQLWSYQGGPIILAQVENEIGHEEDLEDSNLIIMTDLIGTSRVATMQDYADWCGFVAAKLAPKVIWTMCNGLTAPNAINTCNGYGGVSCSRDWLESYGQNGRIQVDQPAMWTENEAGFQVWGETPEQSSYFWGRSARDVAKDDLNWFARGGSHINYYMWWGGYNRGRAAAGGITNMYASDAVLCPSGQRRQPKYDHLQRLHRMMISIAPYVLESESGLHKEQRLLTKGSAGKWEFSDNQRMFLYGQDCKRSTCPLIAFLENDSQENVTVLVRAGSKNQSVALRGDSTVVLIDGKKAFDSAFIDPSAVRVRRLTTKVKGALSNWQSRFEPVGANPDDVATLIHSAPNEQTQLMVTTRMSSDYAWYTTTFKVSQTMGLIRNATIAIEAQKACAMTVYLNDSYMDTKAHPHHEEGNITITMHLGNLSPSLYNLSILSENLGYGNLIGRFGANARAKTKGITGLVTISGTCVTGLCQLNLIDANSRWYSVGGLNGERQNVFAPESSARVSRGLHPSTGVWSRVLFDTAVYNLSSQNLFLDIASGMGRIWLNGIDLGRYWNITRGDSSVYTQRYYFLPKDYLHSSGELNELILFNTIGGNNDDTSLVLSELQTDESATMEDMVDFPSACL